ncbi:MAG: hypothetical protein EOP86_21865 [Verrucomicrobiaceae bacterium]|nr:MAG: hypothetical protein EOP86_21865 [Verrucomicrobiaceae bacterium]
MSYSIAILLGGPRCGAELRGIRPTTESTKVPGGQYLRSRRQDSKGRIIFISRHLNAAGK